MLKEVETTPEAIAQVNTEEVTAENSEVKPSQNLSSNYICLNICFLTFNYVH